MAEKMIATLVPHERPEAEGCSLSHELKNQEQCFWPGDHAYAQAAWFLVKKAVVLLRLQRVFRASKRPDIGHKRLFFAICLWPRPYKLQPGGRQK